jgi:CheY-like chemotaxis protein
MQIDSALNRQYDGTGLGLALVKRLTELHGGRVILTSKKGVGSCFTIQLPYSLDALDSLNNLTSKFPDEYPSELISSTVASTTTNITPNTASSVPLVLLVEDNEANINTISSYLKAKGYQILSAKDGQSGIALAKAHQPDVIMMDIQMPGMDGLEATRQLRLDPDLADTPIIALTALAMTGDREKCLAAGANEYLTKPVRLKELFQMLQTLLER